FRSAAREYAIKYSIGKRCISHFRFPSNDIGHADVTNKSPAEEIFQEQAPYTRRTALAFKNCGYIGRRRRCGRQCRDVIADCFVQSIGQLPAHAEIYAEVMCGGIQQPTRARVSFPEKAADGIRGVVKHLAETCEIPDVRGFKLFRAVSFEIE